MQDEIIAYVYKTYDYDKFKKLEANRPVEKKRRDALVRSFSEKEVLNPIIVNEKFETIDGQEEGLKPSENWGPQFIMS